MKKKLSINPWLSVWFNPINTIKEIVSYNPNYRIVVFSFVFGSYFFILTLLKIFMVSKLGIFFLSFLFLFLSLIFGYIYISFAAFLVFLAAKILKGEATYKQVRAAFMWAHVPAVLSLVFVNVLIVHSLVSENLALVPVFRNLFFLSMFISFLFSIWSFVLYLHTLSFVQKFSKLKAFFSLIIASILSVLFMGVVILIFKFTCSHFFDEPVLVFNKFINWNILN